MFLDVWFPSKCQYFAMKAGNRNDTNKRYDLQFSGNPSFCYVIITVYTSYLHLFHYLYLDGFIILIIPFFGVSFNFPTRIDVLYVKTSSFKNLINRT